MKTTIQIPVLEKLKRILTSEKPRILIIDDHLIAAKAQEMVVLNNHANAVVTIAFSYENSARLLECNQYDLILLDNELLKWKDSKGRLGTTFIPLIRKTSPEGFILFTSMNIAVGQILSEQKQIDYAVDKGKLFDFFEELEHESA